MCAAAMVSCPLTAPQLGETAAAGGWRLAAGGWRLVAAGPGGYDALPAPALTAVTVKIDLAAFAQV